MYKPILSIDVAKGRSIATAFLAHEQPFHKAFSFTHTVSGLQSTTVLLEKLEHFTKLKPHVVLEATGHYSKSLISFFHSLGYPLVVLNPLQTHHLKHQSIRKIKTDQVDTARIAHAFYMGYGSHYVELDQHVLELRTLHRQYDHICELFAETQLHFRAVLDVLFPGFDQVFRRICSPSALRLLSAYPTPQDILQADREVLIQLLLPNRRGRKWNEAKLDALIAMATNSLPDTVGKMANQLALQSYIQLLHAYKSSLHLLEAQMLTWAEQIPAYSLLRSIPGVGELTALIFLAEIGDIKRFPTSKQLTAFAGLDSSVYESGTFRSSQNRISKRGSNYLRKAFYQATVCGISQQIKGPRNSILSQYYNRKLAEGKPTKVAIIATCHKLLRMVYGVWMNGIPFKAE